jgi:hypothetical protein
MVSLKAIREKLKFCLLPFVELNLILIRSPEQFVKAHGVLFNHGTVLSQQATCMTKLATFQDVTCQGKLCGKRAHLLTRK